ncbi:YIP1 family protein [candidate division KSB1 bacterium]|nr:YIP1 family protein [candidate division KSB1 bacterium]
MNKAMLKSLLDRVKDILLKPRETWETIATEETTVNTLLSEYLLPLAAVPAIASFLGMWLIGIWITLGRLFRLSMTRSLLNALLGYILMIGGIWLVGKIIAFLAPRFGSEKDERKAFQVAVYGYTPYLAAGIFHLVPRLDAIVIIGGLYSFYQVYLGLPIVMKTPKEKALPYVISVMVIIVLIYIVIGAVSSLIFSPVHV